MWKIASPDHTLTVTISGSNDGALSYGVDKNGVPAGNGALGILTSIGDFSAGLRYVGQSERMIDETYSLPAGKKAEYVNQAREVRLRFEKEDVPFDLLVRAYDNGAAFRYEILEESGGDSLRVYREATDFCFPESFDTLWLQDWVASYEGPYNRSVWGSGHNGRHYGMPSLLHAPEDGLWVMINEANVLNTNGSYCISHVKGTGTRRLLLEFAPEEKGEPIPSPLPFRSPWRYLLVEQSLDAVVNSTMNYNLNPPSEIEDTSWIKPARALWAWWSSDMGAQIFTEAKQYVDFAAWAGFEAVVMDAGWDETWIKEFCAYAHERNISPWLWTAMQTIDTYETASYYLPLWKSWGIDGVKIDFFENDSAHTASCYHMMADIMKEQKLMINFHGSTKPMGEGRTWPHFITAEGIMALEYYKWSDMPNAEHNCTVPFIRNAAGPMDYTPVGFSNENRNTSMAHQMALAAVYDSGCQHYSASIFHMEPWRGTDFLRRLKPKYDGVKLLSGFPGDHAAILRWTKKTEEYVIGCICNQSRILRLSFDFLPEGEFEAEIYGDNRFGDAITYEKIPVTRDGFVDIAMPEHGGAGLYIARKILPLAPVYNKNYMHPPVMTLDCGEARPFTGSEIANLSEAGDQTVLLLRGGGALVCEGIPEAKNYTLRLHYCAHAAFQLRISDGRTCVDAWLPAGGPGTVFTVADVVMRLEEGPCRLVLTRLSGGEPLISKLAVIGNDPEAPICLPVETGVLSGAGYLMEDPFGSYKLQGMTKGSTLTFNDVMLPDAARYVLRVDYSAAPTGIAEFLVNGGEPINVKLNGMGMWRRTKEGDVLALEILAPMQKGRNTIVLKAQTTLPPIRNIQLIKA